MISSLKSRWLLITNTNRDQNGGDKDYSNAIDFPISNRISAGLATDKSNERVCKVNYEPQYFMRIGRKNEWIVRISPT